MHQLLNSIGPCFKAMYRFPRKGRHSEIAQGGGGPWVRWTNENYSSSSSRHQAWTWEIWSNGFSNDYLICGMKSKEREMKSKAPRMYGLMSFRMQIFRVIRENIAKGLSRLFPEITMTDSYKTEELKMNKVSQKQAKFRALNSHHQLLWFQELGELESRDSNSRSLQGSWRVGWSSGAFHLHTPDLQSLHVLPCRCCRRCGLSEWAHRPVPGGPVYSSDNGNGLLLWNAQFPRRTCTVHCDHCQSWLEIMWWSKRDSSLACWDKEITSFKDEARGTQVYPAGTRR